MQKVFRVITIAISSVALIGVLGISLASADDGVIAEGKKLTFDRKKGNCLACHAIAGGDQAGNIGPPLIVMKARFPDIAVLKAQISDPRTKNQNSIMPPFGTHGIMTKEEIDKVTAYIYTL